MTPPFTHSAQPTRKFPCLPYQTGNPKLTTRMSVTDMKTSFSARCCRRVSVPSKLAAQGTSDASSPTAPSTKPELLPSDERTRYAHDILLLMRTPLQTVLLRPPLWALCALCASGLRGFVELPRPLSMAFQGRSLRNQFHHLRSLRLPLYPATLQPRTHLAQLIYPFSNRPPTSHDSLSTPVDGPNTCLGLSISLFSHF